MPGPGLRDDGAELKTAPLPRTRRRRPENDGQVLGTMTTTTAPPRRHSRFERGDPGFETTAPRSRRHPRLEHEAVALKNGGRRASRRRRRRRLTTSPQPRTRRRRPEDNDRGLEHGDMGLETTMALLP
jgi:hypothetical protein